MKLSELIINQPKDNIYFYGQGGAGKSFSLISLFKSMLKETERRLIPIYVPLAEYTGEDFIKTYIIRRYLGQVKDNDKIEQLYKLFNDFSDDRRFILVLDGLNEASGVDRDSKPMIAEIEYLAKNCTNLQIIVSAREDNDSLLSFKRFKLMPLTRELVSKKIKHYYLLSTNLQNIILAPFYFVKYIEISENKTEIMSAGQLIKSYLEETIKKTIHYEYKEYIKLIIFGFLPYLSFEMSLDGSLVIEKSKFNILLRKWSQGLTEDESYFAGKIDYRKIEVLKDFTIASMSNSKIRINEVYRDFFAAIFEKEQVHSRADIHYISFEAANKNILQFVDEIMEYPKDYNFVELRIPQGVIKISEKAFLYCGKINSLVLPESVKTIGRSAFSGCGGLMNVNGSNNLLEIDDNAFESCVMLNKFVFHKSLRKIGNEALSSCVSLNRIHLPDNILFIGNGVFSDAFLSDFCMERSDILELKNNVDVWDDAGMEFQNFSHMKIDELSINCNKTYFSYENNLYIDNQNGTYSLLQYTGNIGKEYFTIPEQINNKMVVCIEPEAFYGNGYLKMVGIPSSISEIKDYAFSFCEALEYVMVPSTVTKIGIGAFSGCSCTIICKNKSVAHKYAIDNNIKHKF